MKALKNFDEIKTINLKPQLSNNLQTFKTLRQLKEKGLYIGSIENSSFELLRNKRNQFFSINGELNKTGLIIIKCSLIIPIRSMFRIFLTIGFLLSIFVIEFWLSKIAIISICLLSMLITKYRSNRELELFQEMYSKNKVEE